MNANGWKFQFGLGWGAYAILVCALGLGWYRAHTQAVQDLERLPGDLIVMKQQIAVLTEQIEKGAYYPHGRMYLRSRPEQFTPPRGIRLRAPETADLFVQQLERIRQNRGPLPYQGNNMFQLKLFQLYEMPDEAFHETVPAVIRFVEVPEARVRQAALWMLHGLMLKQGPRMAPHIPVLVDVITNRLSDADDLVRIQAAQALEAIGPGARSALSRLEKIEADDRDEVAVFAALAMDAIDPQYDAVPRLIDLIEKRTSDWEFAAEYLPEIAPTDVAERVLRSQMMPTAMPDDNMVFARVLSGLERRQMFAKKASTP